MIGVIFEVLPHPERKQEYLEIAASIRPELEIKFYLSVFMQMKMHWKSGVICQAIVRPNPKAAEISSKITVFAS
jgi:hypothetical protein